MKFLAFSDFCGSSKAKNDNSHLHSLETKLDSSMSKVCYCPQWPEHTENQNLPKKLVELQTCLQGCKVVGALASIFVTEESCSLYQWLKLSVPETTFRTQVLKDCLSFPAYCLLGSKEAQNMISKESILALGIWGHTGTHSRMTACLRVSVVVKRHHGPGNSNEKNT